MAKHYCFSFYYLLFLRQGQIRGGSNRPFSFFIFLLLPNCKLISCWTHNTYMWWQEKWAIMLCHCTCASTIHCKLPAHRPSCHRQHLVKASAQELEGWAPDHVTDVRANQSCLMIQKPHGFPAIKAHLKGCGCVTTKWKIYHLTCLAG